MSTALVPPRALAPLLVLLAAGAACKSAESKAWNLGQLHDEESRHRYRAALESDFEYVLRHDVAGLLRGAGASLAAKEPSAVEDPSQACLENLIDLGRYGMSNARQRSLQVQWCARLAVRDPSKLCRERAVLSLGGIGAALGAGVPVALPKDPPPATAEEVAGAAAQLVRSVRAKIDPSKMEGPPPPALSDACAAVEALVLDLEGGRRALDAVTQLGALSGLDAADRDRLRRSGEDLARRLVRQALAAALLDKEPVVRAAAVESSVRSGGLAVLDSMVLHFERERAPEVVARVLAIVAKYGLPEPPADRDDVARARWREEQLRSLYTLLVTRPESQVRVAAMQALSRVADAGFESLREEDWQAWFRARAEAVPDASGGAQRAGAAREPSS